MFSLKRKTVGIQDFIARERSIDSFVLDDNNVLVVINNSCSETNDFQYAVVHKRLINQELVEINRWYTNNGQLSHPGSILPIESLNSVKVRSEQGCFSALYNYHSGEFVIPDGEWLVIKECYGDVDLLDKYQCFLALFYVCSDFDDTDMYSYTNPITKKKCTGEFRVSDDAYYAILNVDGSIRGNKLFRGDDFSRIDDVIDLGSYSSLEEFKQERKEACNLKKENLKKEFYLKMGEGVRTGEDLFLNSEVVKVLELRK